MDDLISRQDAIRAVMTDVRTDRTDCLFHANMICKRIEELPSAEPVRMKGKWGKQIDESINAWWYECSVCGDYPLKDAFGHDCLSQFCPWCGAEMSEGEENEKA